MEKTWLLLGGNIGDTLAYFSKVKHLLGKKAGNILKESAIFASEAWGFEAENDFRNQIIEIETNMQASEILEITQQIEKELGRVKTKAGYESRIIDIDILFYGNKVIRTEKLTIPHERLHLRKFTLLPLVSLWPKLLHPVFQKTAEQLLTECTDETKTWEIINN